MIQLEKMTERDFIDYLSLAIPDYAAEKVSAGAWAKEAAQKLSEESFAELLPNGVATKDHHLFSIVKNESSQKVGYMWFRSSEDLNGKAAFIFDFIVFEEFRSRGYGTQTMLALEETAKKMGIEKIMLHVFAHNKTAFSLYEKMGFNMTDISMSKYL
ncbi:GNAT family N-acetyltransferase [Carnobacterium mobile]|uniref:GNAT family N-acetyltransferase n=1 Tax=Carnobacterium mobile TaxID=2750 RepID=UPI001D00B603|nr:GNAT family N-acetyltransferase [Carnobacterium mobile]